MKILDVEKSKIEEKEKAALKVQARAEENKKAGIIEIGKMSDIVNTF